MRDELIDTRISPSWQQSVNTASPDRGAAACAQSGAKSQTTATETATNSAKPAPIGVFRRAKAEREGFEPSMDGTAHTGFRDQTTGV
jgi:hypothetical protein